tara:strand:+ start:252 stop:779 length:528 start_codon:yes stop_codon:yes gene_type:complete
MGSKRVGLARTQALIQNLARELNMNNATLTNTKGVELCATSALTSIPVAIGTTDLSVTLPINAFVTDVGFINTLALGGGSSSTTEISAGWDSAGAVDVVAAAVVCNASSIASAAAGWSAASGKKGDASGAAIALVDGGDFYRTTSDTMYMRIEVKTAVLDAISAGYMYVKYFIVP